MAETEVSARSSMNLGFGPTLQNRRFVLLWVAQIISQTIQNAINYGSIVLLANQSNSFTAVGGVLVAFSLPAVIFGIPAGVVVDRFDKRAVLWISNALRAVGALGFIASLTIDSKSFVPIYLLTFFIAIVGQFFGPAEGAAIPLLVGADDVLPALSLFNITFSISQAAGLVIVGPLIVSLIPTLTLHFGSHVLQLTSMHWLFIFIGLMYLVCVGLILAIPRQSFVGDQAPTEVSATGRRVAGMWRGVVEAGSFVHSDRRLMIAILQLTLGNVIIGVVAVIAPLFVSRFLGLPTSLATVIFVPAGVGLVAGSTLMPRIIDRIGLPLAEALGVIGVSGFTLLIALGNGIARGLQIAGTRPYLFVVMILIFGIGLSLDLVTLPAQTIMQRRSPDWVRGRILSLQVMIFNAASIPIVLTIGPVADRFGLTTAIVVLSITVAVLGLGGVVLADGRDAFVPKRDDPTEHSYQHRRAKADRAQNQTHQKARVSHEDLSGEMRQPTMKDEERGTSSRPMPTR